MNIYFPNHLHFRLCSAQYYLASVGGYFIFVGVDFFGASKQLFLINS